MSLFNALEIAKRSLYVSQAALDLTGHNVANADTDGYTRQRIVVQSIEPANMSSRLAAISTNAIGGGVSIQSIDQIRDKFLDREFRRENSDLGKWDTLTEQMGYIESLMNETTDNGISNTLSKFFDSLAELSMSPTSDEVRTTVQQDAINLTESFNHYSKQLIEMQKTQNDNVKVTVDNINAIIKDIATYNKQIYNQELSGVKANDLRDKRNLLLDQLSHFVNIEYAENSDGKLTVSVNGHDLINHTDTTLLETVADQSGVVSGETGFYSIYYEGTTTPFEFSSGELMGYVQMRDGNSVDSIGIPRLLDNLNTLARSIAQEFNNINSNGYTAPYDSTSSQTGINFFDVPSGDYSLVTAGNIRLSDELLESPRNIACSDQLIDLSADNEQSGNNVNILKMVELRDSSNLADVGSFEGYLKSVVVGLAIESANCQTLYSGQTSVMENLDTRRQSVSSVSIDEEMINMIKMQHAYSAASRVISAVDEALDVLINRTGMVGR